MPFEQIGQMQARYDGSTNGVHRWFYRSQFIDDARAMASGSPEHWIDIVLPDTYADGKSYPVLYIGPVNTNDRQGLLAAQAADVHNDYQCILVSNAFRSVPWYGTKSDGTQRVDTFIKGGILSLMRQRYNSGLTAEDTLLLGYSKSGWGALSLLLNDRTRSFFGYAAGWDAPWASRWPNRSLVAAFGTEARVNMFHPVDLAAKADATMKSRERVWLGCGRTWVDHHLTMVKALVKANIPHRTRFLREPDHSWDSDWMAEAVQEMFEMREV